MSKFKVGDIIKYRIMSGGGRHKYYLIVDECYEAYERMPLSPNDDIRELILFKCHEKYYTLEV
jgi:hypothetical protein